MKWIPKWVLKLIGRSIAEKLDLKETPMDEKKWFRSKGVWTAVVGGLIAIYGAVGTVHPLPPIPEWVLTLLASIGLYSIRTADTKIS